MSDVSDTAERSPETIGTTPGGRRGGPNVLSRAGTLFLKQREASVLAIAVVLFIYFAVTTHAFFSHGSFVNISQYMAPYVIIGIGMVLVMVCLEIDLSVGFVWTLSPFVMRFFIDSGIPTFLAIVITVLILAIIVGGINGVVTTIFGVPSLITTLATGYIVFGYTLTVSSAQQVNVPPTALGLGHWFGSEAWSEIIWATVLVLIFQMILTNTRWGLYTVSVGGNLLGAREAGIKVNRIKIGNFMLCSGLGALAGILEAFKNNIIDPSAGQLSVVLVAIAGAVIGGTAMSGGSGTMIGMWLGMLVLGILQDGFNLRGISSNEYLIILGAAILLAMIANTYLARLRSAAGCKPSRDATQHGGSEVSTQETGGDLTPAGDDILRVDHISKRYGAVTALVDVNLRLERGEVLALVGDNGAGKSTLLKIICGFQQPTSGRILFNGEEVTFGSVKQARAMGINIVYQDLALVNQLTVYENMFLNREPVRWPLLRKRQMRKEAQEHLDSMGIKTLKSVDLEVASLSGGQRQAIAVARSVFSNAKVLLLDEPLAAMGVKEGAMILDLVRDLKEQGMSIIIIAHNYGQVFPVVDRVNLLQSGQITFDKYSRDTSVEELTEIVVAEYRKALEERHRAAS